MNLPTAVNLPESESVLALCLCASVEGPRTRDLSAEASIRIEQPTVFVSTTRGRTRLRGLFGQRSRVRPSSSR